MRQMTRNPRRALCIYDPREGQSRHFTLASGTHVSAGSMGFWVAETQGFDWQIYAGTVTDLAASAGGMSYVTYLPWWPSISRRAKDFARGLEQVGRIVPLDENLVVAHSADRRPLVLDCLRLRAKLGGSGSGLWSVGQASDFDALLNDLRDPRMDADSPILSTAGSLQSINLALCMDDGVDALFVKLNSVSPNLLDELFSALKRDQTQALE